MVTIDKQKYQIFKNSHQWNDSKFANKLGISHAYLSRILDGDRMPSGYFIEQYLNITQYTFEQAFVSDFKIKHAFQKYNYKKLNGQMPYVEFSEMGHVREEERKMQTIKNKC